MSPPRRSAKVLLLGDIGVGKTSLANRFVFDRFDGAYKTTLGVDILTHDLALGPECDDEALRLVLWDTDGDFGDRIFSTAYALGAQAALIVADASRPETLTHMGRLAVDFGDRFPGRPMRAIVNKIDLVAPADRAFDIADIDPDEIALTSAATGEGVAALFRSLGQAIWRCG
jgi:GTPase SAR1 family protein